MLQGSALLGANPLDAEIRRKPRVPAAAPEAGAGRGGAPARAPCADLAQRAPSPTGRSEDWATLAIASERLAASATRATRCLVTLALAPNLERQCRAGARRRRALRRTPARAGRGDAAERARVGCARQSAFCEWPPYWVASGALIGRRAPSRLRGGRRSASSAHRREPLDQRDEHRVAADRRARAAVRRRDDDLAGALGRHAQHPLARARRSAILGGNAGRRARIAGDRRSRRRRDG